MWADHGQYDTYESQPTSVALSGIGDEAHLGSSYTVQVKKGTRAFFTQAMNPVEDEMVSTEVASAVSSAMMSTVLQYEAAFRFAKLVVNDL